MTTMTGRKLRLHELPHQMQAIDEAIDALDGELPPMLEAELDALEMALEDKADAIAALIREAEAEAAFYAAELERIGQRVRVATNRRERLKDYLHRNLVALGRDRIDTGRFKVRVQRNSAPSIRWAGPDDAIPEPFRRVRVELDGTAAREAYKANVLPDGFEVTTGTHLRIS